MAIKSTEKAFHVRTGQGGFAPKGGQYVAHKNGDEKFYKGGQFLPLGCSSWTKKQQKEAERFAKDLRRWQGRIWDAIQSVGTTGYIYEITNDFGFRAVFYKDGVRVFGSHGMTEAQAREWAESFFTHRIVTR